MIHKKLSLISLIFFLPILSIADPDFKFTSDQECTEKRLDLPPGASSKVPIQDQDGTNLCTAYMSAQLIDAWRIANKPPVTEFTSPIALGVQYSSRYNKQRLAEFSGADVLEKSKTLDSCSYNVVRDDFNSRRSADYIYDLLKNFKAAKENPAQRTIAANAILNCVLASGTNKTFNIEQIKSYMDENHWVNFTNKILENICEGHKSSLDFLPPVERFKTSDSKDQFQGMAVFREKINERLNKPNAQPMGITYCRSVLEDKNVEGVNTSGSINKNSCAGEIHSSVIVGRRLLKYKNGDKIDTICQFLVRDSFGSSCNGYPANEAESIPSKPGGEKPKVCERGQVWVDENALLRNTSELYYLKDN